MSFEIIWGKPKRDNSGEIVTKRYKNLDEEIDKVDESTDISGNQVYFWDDVSDYSVMNLIGNLRRISDRIANDRNYKTTSPIPIWIYVNSYGGDLLAGFNAMDEIMNIRNKIPIYTVVDGKSASASTFINIAGTRRFMKKNSFMLIHELSSITWGKFSDQADHMKNMEMFMNKIKDAYVENTNLKRDQLDEILSHDIWLDSDKALEYGLVDEIV